MLGKTVSVSFKKLVPCRFCGGRGSDLIKCPVCKGTGSIISEFHGGFVHQIRQFPCDRCATSGWLTENACEHCQGIGLVEEDRIERIDLSTFYGNVNELVKKIPGGGHYGKYGGPPGPLFLHLIVDFPRIENIPITAIHHLRRADELMSR